MAKQQVSANLVGVAGQQQVGQLVKEKERLQTELKKALGEVEGLKTLVA